MVTAVSVRIRRSGRAQQRKAQYIALCVIAILRFVDQAETVLTIAEISPTDSRHLEFRCFPTVVPCSGAVDRTVGNFIGSFGAGSSERKGCLQQNMRFMPVNIIAD